MIIEKTNESRLSQVDFSKLEFGKIFSDHMLVCHYKNGAWQEPKIMPYKKLDFALSLHALHYGQAAFEGQKAYYTESGRVAIFRPDANWERLNRSAERLQMPHVPREVFVDGMKQLINLDKAWVPRDPEKALYIRPFIFSSSEFIAARPSEEYIFAIICSPVGAYYSGAVRVKIEEKYTRSASGGIGFTKAAGNYGGAFYPTAQAVKQGYNQVIWTDHRDHKLIEESGTMNVMFLLDGKLVTPPLTDRILPGITRDSLLKVAREMGIETEERPISVDEISECFDKGTLQEAFGAGTAAVVSQIKEITYGEKVMPVPTPEYGIARTLKANLNKIRLGTVEDTRGWMVYVD